MTNERLEVLKTQVARAELLAEHITALTENEHEADAHKMPYMLRCEVYRLGREALLQRKEAELESLLTTALPEPPLPEVQVDPILPCGLAPGSWTDAPSIKQFAESA